MKKVNVMLVFIAALLLSCTTAFADGGVVRLLRITDTSYNKVLSSTSQVSPSNLGEFALDLFYDEGSCVSGPNATDFNVDITGVEIRTYTGKYVLNVIDQFGDYHYVGYYVGDDFHIYWSDSHPGDLAIDDDTSFSEAVYAVVNSMYDHIASINYALTRENGPFALWMSLLDTDLDLVNLTLEEINLRIKSLVDYTNVIANGTVTLVEKMDELIEAVNGISISADGATINFDTLPITNKLDEVITAIEGISVNVEGGTFDTLPITNKLDEVITAINGISINVEGGTVNFDTVPITDKLDEVIDALHDISVEGAFCDHTFVDSGQYTYRTIFLMRSFHLDVGADENGWFDFPHVELVPGETYQVYFNGELYQCTAVDNKNYGTIYQRSTYIGNQVINDQAIPYGYPFSIRNQLVYPTNEVKTTIKLSSDASKFFDISISQRVALSHCSKCGALEDGSGLLQIIGTINSAAATISHAFYEFSNFDFFELTQELRINQGDLVSFLSDNHVDLVSKLDAIAEVLAPVASCEHSYMPVVMVEPSCDFPGVTKFTCEYCGTFRVEFSEPLGHEWMDFTPPEPVVLLENAPFDLIDGSSPPMLGNMALIALTLGEQYRVIYNGIEYITECTMLDYDGLQLPVIGNADAFLGTGDNGCPFVLASSEILGGTGCFDFSGATTAIVSVYTVPEESENVPDYMQPLLVCSRCDSGHNLAGVMEFLDERLVPGSGGGSDLTPVLTRMDTIIESLGVDLGAAGCEHVYVAEVNQEQTCVLPGLQTHTCELCGSSYSEILESLGHDWQCTEHVEDELDPETGEVISSGYDIYTCSICDDTYNDYDGNGAPEDGSTSITGIVSRVFEKIGSLVGELLAMSVRLLDKLLTGFDEIVTSFNEKTQQIVSFGSGYTAWLSGFWGIVPSDLQLALSFCVVVICLGIIGKKVVFAS